MSVTIDDFKRVIIHNGYVHLPNADYTLYVAIFAYRPGADYMTITSGEKHYFGLRDYCGTKRNFDIGARCAEDVQHMITELSCVMRGVELPIIIPHDNPSVEEAAPCLEDSPCPEDAPCSDEDDAPSPDKRAECPKC